MARGVSNPGRTARHYRKNSASRAKHVKDNSPGGKYVKSKEYKREHADARRKLKIRGDQDAVRKNGNLVAGNRKANRARGGAQRA